MPPIRVLFIHGLESRPQGSKVRLLREHGFDVVAPDMQMGLLRLERHNSVIRQLLRLPETRLAVACVGIMLVLCIVGSSIPGFIATMLTALAWVAVRGRTLVAKAFGRSFAACVEIQRAAVQREQPDVVVGSSWGGAVAAELIVLDEWSGPSILLAPAIQTVATWMRQRDIAQKVARIQASSMRVPMLIFHDPSDETIPYEHSEQLANGSRIELRSVTAGGHRLMEILHRGELSEAIHAIVSPPPGPAPLQHDPLP